MKLKPDGSPVLLYDGSVKANQGSAAAVFDLDIGGENLQQCADSVLRIYAEYFWATGQQDRLKFHLTSGFLTDWETWKNGGRLAVSGSSVSWQQAAGPDDSYENFRKYFRNVIIYAGTISLDAESEPIQADEIKAGDLWVQGGSPGHCVLVVDTADFVGDRGDRNEGGEDGDVYKRQGKAQAGRVLSCLYRIIPVKKPACHHRSQFRSGICKNNFTLLIHGNLQVPAAVFPVSYTHLECSVCQWAQQRWPAPPEGRGNSRARTRRWRSRTGSETSSSAR